MFVTFLWSDSLCWEEKIFVNIFFDVIQALRSCFYSFDIHIEFDCFPNYFANKKICSSTCKILFHQLLRLILFGVKFFHELEAHFCEVQKINEYVDNSTKEKTT